MSYLWHETYISQGISRTEIKLHIPIGTLAFSSNRVGCLRCSRIMERMGVKTRPSEGRENKAQAADGCKSPCGCNRGGQQPAGMQGERRSRSGSAFQAMKV